MFMLSPCVGICRNRSGVAPPVAQDTRTALWPRPMLTQIHPALERVLESPDAQVDRRVDMREHQLLLLRPGVRRDKRRHDGRAAVDRCDARWCSDGFTDVDANEEIDDVMLLGFLRLGLCRVNGLACNKGGKSRHPRYGRRRNVPAKLLSAITSHPPGPVTTPRDHDCDWGRKSCRAWPPKTPIIGARR